MKLSLTLAIIIASIWASSQNVNIPDPYFKNYLINNSAINTNGDNEIQLSEANAYSSFINVDSRAISDLTGIEAFVNIFALTCADNQISELDISQNTNLTSFSCGRNNLSEIDISSNTSLTLFQCNNNYITELDLTYNVQLETIVCYSNNIDTLHIENNTQLKLLICHVNNLNELNTSSNTLLEDLWINNNNISSFDFSSNPELYHLIIDFNPLTHIDLSNNPLLWRLFCSSTSLTELDLSNNPNLTWLECDFTQITSLDLSNNGALIKLFCQGNQLSELNVQNGNNSGMYNLDARNNPNLTCITVDDVAYAEAHANSGGYGEWDVDPEVAFSLDCSIAGIVKPKTNNEFQIHPNPVESILNINGKGYRKAMIYTLDGRMVLEATNNSIDVSMLDNSAYSLYVYNVSGEIIMRKIFIKTGISKL